MGGVAGFEVEGCKGELVLRAGQAQHFSVCGVLVFGFVSHGPPAFLPGRTWARLAGVDPAWRIQPLQGPGHLRR